MNEEKPSEPKVDGRPFDNGVGPTVQAVEGLPIGRPQLSARQLHGDTTTPSWKSAEKHGISTAALIAIVVVLAVVALILLKIAGVL